MRLNALAAGLLLLASVTMAGCGGTTEPTKTNGNEPAGTMVDMEEFLFKPDNLTVKKGTKVTWKNKDSVAHTVTSEGNAGPLDSQNLAAGQTYSYTFNEVGTFKYFCKPHAASMKGTVVVTA